jgi:hypothetical protein
VIAVQAREALDANFGSDDVGPVGKYACMYMCMCIWISCMQARMFRMTSGMLTSMYVYTYVCMYIRTYAYAYVRMYVCMHAYVFGFLICKHVCLERRCASWYVCMYVFICIWISHMQARGMLGERGLGLVVHFHLGSVAKINTP